MPIVGAGRRRLQQGRPGRPSVARSATAQEGSVELPPIRPPACPLDDAAIQDLQLLSQNRDMAKLENQIQTSLCKISSSCYTLNHEIQQLRNLTRRLPEKKAKEKEALQAKLDDVEQKMHALTEQSERGVRELIDLKAELADSKNCLGEVAVQADMISRHRRGEEARIQEALETALMADGENMEAKAGILDQNVESMLDLLQARKNQAAAEYEQFSVPQKYARNNDYISWKRQWHEGLHGEDMIVPDPKTWFDRNGDPIFHYGGEAADDRQMDADEDLVVEREIVSTRCPLSLAEMTEPYTSRKCNHTFQKAVILEYVGYRAVQCPVAGCNETMSKRDLFFDQALLRKFERQRRERRETRGSDAEDNEDDKSAVDSETVGLTDGSEDEDMAD